MFYLLYTGNTPLELYNIFQNKKYGKESINIMVGILSPYSGSIYPTIDLYNENECRCIINECFSLKNPFNSIHAIALNNLGELTSGLLMVHHLKTKNKKGIVTNISCQYYKKAKGMITCVSNINSLKDGLIVSKLFDKNNVLVCQVITTWNIKNANA